MPGKRRRERRELEKAAKQRDEERSRIMAEAQRANDNAQDRIKLAMFSDTIWPNRLQPKDWEAYDGLTHHSLSVGGFYVYNDGDKVEAKDITQVIPPGSRLQAHWDPGGSFVVTVQPAEPPSTYIDVPVSKAQPLRLRAGKRNLRP